VGIVSRCANCGSRTASASARRVGREWFCSQSCLLQAESSRARGKRSSSHGRRGSVRLLRKTVKWTLIVVGLLVVISVVAAIVGVGNSNTSKGSARSHPVPLHRLAAIGGGWKMRVVKVTPNANQQVIAVPESQISAGATGRANHAPPAGAQDFMILVALTYTGGGKDNAGDLVNYGLHAMGAHNARYEPQSDSCGDAWPRPSLQNAGVLYSGRGVRGNICLQIAKNDARTLMLYSGNSQHVLFEYRGLKKVWFALR
jgi:hypothetical protein